MPLIMENRIKSQIAPIEAARGNLKVKLEQDCLSLVLDRNKSFNHDSLRQFIEKMIKLTGGQPDEDGIITSPKIQDEDNKRTIHLRKKGIPLVGIANEVIIEIKPSFLGLSKAEREEAESKPRLGERISIKPNQSAIVKTCAIIYPEKYPGLALQNYMGETILLRKGARTEEYDERFFVPNEEANGIAVSILAAWQKSQMQQKTPSA